MNSEFIYKNIFRTNNNTEVINLLREIPMFKHMTSRQINRILQYTHLRTYSPNEIIFKDKEPGLGMYIIKSGKIKVVLNQGGLKEKVLADLHSGDFFGELALIDEIHRSASAIAVKESELIAFFRPDLLSLCDKDPGLGNKILMELAKIVSFRLRKTNEELQNLKKQ